MYCIIIKTLNAWYFIHATAYSNGDYHSRVNNDYSGNGVYNYTSVIMC